MAHHTIAQVSDTHLSATHGYFYDNWRVLCEDVRRHSPDLVVHSGDLCFNAPDAPLDLEFARTELARLPSPWLAIPGNHDVGEPGEQTRLGQAVNVQRLDQWTHNVGAAHFCHDLGDWRLIGLNTEIMGSGLRQEREQQAFLDASLAASGGRPIGLFLHKPLFISEPEEADGAGHCVLRTPRLALMRCLERFPLRFVASGHLHSYHYRQEAGIDYVWCPTTAMVQPHRQWPVPVANRAGYLQWQFDNDSCAHTLIEPPLMANIDLTNWTRSEGTTITLPPRPVTAARCNH